VAGFPLPFVATERPHGCDCCCDVAMNLVAVLCFFLLCDTTANTCG
jgi:hypothetical protein